MGRGVGKSRKKENCGLDVIYDRRILHNNNSSSGNNINNNNN